MERHKPDDWSSWFEGKTRIELQALRDVPRASCSMPSRPARGPRRAKLTLAALEKLVPLPPELAELRSDSVRRDVEHADAIPRPLAADGSGARSKPYELFDVGELEKPCNDNRPMKLGELERVMSFELAKVQVNTALPRELADLRDDLELLFPPELVGLSR